MSDLLADALQISPPELPFQRSQFRAGNDGTAFRFVSSGSLGAQRRDIAPLSASRYNAPGGQMGQGRHPTMRAILTGLLLCTALATGDAHAQSKVEPTPEDIARGKALTDAGDCASCHTADAAKPFAGGKRIETPFGVIY